MRSRRHRLGVVLLLAAALLSAGPPPARTGRWTELRLRAAPLRTAATDQQWTTQLSVTAGRIEVTTSDGLILAIPPDAVRAIGYARDAFRDTVFLPGNMMVPVPLPWRGVLGKSGVHLLSIEFVDASSALAGVLLEVKKQDRDAILRALTDVTHRPVSVAAADRTELPTQVPTAVVATPPTGVLPGVPKWRVHWLEAGGEAIVGHAFAPDGSVLAAAAEHGEVQVWRLPGGEPQGPPFALGGDAVRNAVIFGPDGRTLVAARGEAPAALVFWDTATRARVGELALEPYILRLEASRDGRRAAVVRGRGGATNEVLVVDLASRTSEALPTLATRVVDVAFSATGEWLLGEAWLQCLVWGAVSGALERTVPIPPHAAAAIAPDGQVIVIPRPPYDSGVTGEQQLTRSFYQRRNGTASMDGSVFATADWRRSVTIWDRASREPLGAPLVGYRGEVQDLAFSPDGTRLATFSPGHVVVWDVRTQRPMGQCETGPPQHYPQVRTSGSGYVSFSPDGRAVASRRTGDRTIAVCGPELSGPKSAAFSGSRTR